MSGLFLKRLGSAELLRRKIRNGDMPPLPPRVRQFRPPVKTLVTGRTSTTLRSSSIPTCPPSGCGCAAMPEGSAIDHERQMNGTMPPYAQRGVVRVGRDGGIGAA